MKHQSLIDYLRRWFRRLPDWLQALLLAQRRHKLRRISLELLEVCTHYCHRWYPWPCEQCKKHHMKEGRCEDMELIVKVGATVVARLRGHGNKNGEPIPAGSVVTMDSNDETVGAVPEPFTLPNEVPADGFIDLSVTVLGPGATDISHDTETPDGTKYHDAGTLTVEEVMPGLLRISLELVETTPHPEHPIVLPEQAAQRKRGR